MADEVYKHQEHVDFTFVDTLTESLSGREDQRELESAKSRREFARIAMKLAGDRYSAGSHAATAALVATLKFGFKAAENFVKDLHHHESSQ